MNEVEAFCSETCVKEKYPSYLTANLTANNIYIY